MHAFASLIMLSFSRLELRLSAIETNLHIDNAVSLKSREDDVDEPQEEKECARDVTRHGRSTKLATDSLKIERDKVRTDNLNGVTYDSANDEQDEAKHGNNHEDDDTETKVAGRCQILLVAVGCVVGGNDPW